MSTGERSDDSYLVGHIHERLASDPRTNAPEVAVRLEDGAVVAEGCVSTIERKDAVEQVIREAAPGRRVISLVSVPDLPPADAPEEMR